MGKIHSESEHSHSHNMENHGKNDSHSEHGHEQSHSHNGHMHSHGNLWKKFVVSTVLTIPILIFSRGVQSILGFETSIPAQDWILISLSTFIYFYGGFPFLKGSVEELKNKNPGMMTLIATAISVAFFYSVYAMFTVAGKDFFWELATLIDVMLLGHWIEAKSILGASKALEELVKIVPSIAHLVKDDGKIEDVPVKVIRVGDTVLVKPGEKIPSDGVIVKGKTYVNESLLTGESKPVEKGDGDKVIGGSVNENGVIEVKIEKIGSDTYLAQVIGIVQKAQESKSKTQNLADRAAALLFYIALFTGIITFFAWIFVKDPTFALERAVTVLVVACPHALGLAIPLVVAISTAITASRGVLIRDKRAFEVMRNVNAVVFDKTGTLTEGKFGVTNFDTTLEEKEFLSIILSLERNSEHVIGKSISEYAENSGAELLSVENYKTIPGKGVYGEIGGRKIYAGSKGLCKELNLKIPENYLIDENTVGTVVYLIIDNECGGRVVLSDKIRESSKEAIKKLKEMGVKVYMLTGDNREVAEKVGEKVGVDKVFAEVLPNEKSDKILSIKEEGLNVAMVGDGINDAPALVSADVGIAIGAGTDVAIESADIILVKNNPLVIPDLITISGKVYGKMLQNLWWAAGYNIVTIPLAAGVLYNFGILVNPAIGAALMSLSTVIVALNSQTLKKWRNK